MMIIGSADAMPTFLSNMKMETALFAKTMEQFQQIQRKMNWHIRQWLQEIGGKNMTNHIFKHQNMILQSYFCHARISKIDTW